VKIEAAELARALFEEMGDAVFITDPQTGRLLDVNPVAQRLTGLSREKLLGLSVDHLLRSEGDEDLALLRALHTAHRFHSREGYLLRRADNVQVPVDLTLSRLETEDRPLGLLLVRDVTERKQAEERLRQANAELERRVAGRTADLARANETLRAKVEEAERAAAVARDITERKRAEGELRQSHEQMQLILQSITDGIALHGADGRMTYANEALARLVGFLSVRELLAAAPEEIMGRFDIFDEEGRPISPEQLPGARVMLGEPHAEAIVQWRPQAGGPRLCAVVKATAVYDEDKRLRYVVDVFHDITTRRNLEEQVRQAQKMEAIGRLAGGVAHDFNNLLTIINGSCELLFNDLADDLRRDLLSTIRNAGERAANLTGQLLAFSRKAIIAPKVLDLNEVVDTTGKMLRRLIGEDILLVTSLAPGLDKVKADPGQMEQVLMNLAVNARDAMPAGGRLTIETANVSLPEADDRDPELLPGRYVLLRIADTGCGMPDEVKDKVFEPFFTTKEVGKGAGLGLATVYGIVKSYGGHITVDSEAGVGTAFTILLPAEPAAESRETAELPPVAPRGTETILLVEDDDGVRRLARLALEGQGYIVLDSSCGAAAVRAAEAHPGPIHLLLTDVVMPDQGGRQVAEAVRSRRPGLKVLYMSGYTDDAVVRHGVFEATDDFLKKPFTLLALTRKVRSVLDGTSSGEFRIVKPAWSLYHVVD
jgi:two-component system cell cycle sensor histidine kinase/response regulator CckA